MKEFENGWPKNIYDKLSPVVKYIKVGDTKVINTELIYTRVLGIQASFREIDIKQLLSYELSPVSTAMFSEYGEMRGAKAESFLKKILQKEVSSRCIKKAISTVVIDGSAILYIIDLIVNDLCSNTVFPETPNIRQLVVTGEDHVPVELISTVTIKRDDLRTNHEEAANIKSLLLRIRKTRVYLSYPMTQMWLYSCYIIMSSRSLLW